MIAAEACVPGKDRPVAIQNVYVGGRSANVEQRHNLTRLRIVVQLITILERERIHIYYYGLLAGQLNRLLQIRNLVPLASGQEHVNRIGSAASDVIVEVDVRDIERDMLFGVPGK